MKKIVFGITSLRFGGAERVLIDLVNRLVGQYDITVFTLYGHGELEKELDSKIHRVSYCDVRREELSEKEKRKISFDMLFRGKKIYHDFVKGRYDLEIAFLEGPMTWIMAHDGTCPKIAWIHNDLRAYYDKEKLGFLKMARSKKSYRHYQKLIFVSKANLDSFECAFSNLVPKEVIYNYLDTKRVVELSKKEKVTLEKPSYLVVARLTTQKAIARLIRVHKKLIDEGFWHHIYVIGDGPLKEELTRQCHELDCEKTFHLLGAKRNPYPYMKAANYFMLPSYFEGYPMVLLEAKALGKKILLTDSAARECLTDYDLGFIVENNEQALKEGIQLIQQLPAKNKTKTQDQVFEQVVCLLEEFL